VKGVKGSFARIAEPWLKKKGLPFVNSGTKAGVGVRAVISKAMGFSSVSSIEESKVVDAVDRAVKIAKIRPPDPNWVGLPEHQTPSEAGIFDDKVANFDVEEMLSQNVDCCVSAGDVDKRIVNAMSMVSASAVSTGVVNTAGVEVEDKKTVFQAYLDVKAKSGNEEVSSGDMVYSRTFVKDLRPMAVAVGKKTIECLGKKPLPEKYVGPVVFENISWSELFQTIFTYGISASNVQENRSVYKDKLEQTVAVEGLSVFDDGTLPDGWGTARMDDEGVPKQKTNVIEKGVLHGFLFDDYSAKRESGRSTGNACRQRAYGSAAYANQPFIAPSNLLLMPGSGDLDGLVREMKDGVLVKGSLVGAGHSNAVTGDFSVTAGSAFKVENGVVAYSLKPCTVAGNLYAALKNITAIGNDSKCFGNIVCPSIVIDKIVVST
jgi:PmbA protein